MTHSRLTIVILNRNSYSDTRTCLYSLFQCEPANWEAHVLVVDNGSTDGSLDKLLKEFAGRAEFLALGQNRGFATGCNIGIRSALENDASFVLLLNNDTIAERRMLAELYAATQLHPQAGLFSGLIYYRDAPQLLWHAGGIIHPWLGKTRHRGFRRHDAQKYRLQGGLDFFSGCMLLVRREVFAAIGLFDESLFLYFEDVDFCLRARRAGFGMCFVPTAKLWHKVGAGKGRELTATYLYYQTRNRYRVLAQCGGGFYRSYLLALHALIYTGLRMIVLFLSSSGRIAKVSAVWEGFWDSIRQRTGPQHEDMPHENSFSQLSRAVSGCRR